MVQSYREEVKCAESEREVDESTIAELKSVNERLAREKKALLGELEIRSDGGSSSPAKQGDSEEVPHVKSKKATADGKKATTKKFRMSLGGDRSPDPDALASGKKATVGGRSLPFNSYTELQQQHLLWHQSLKIGKS